MRPQCQNPGRMSQTGAGGVAASREVGLAADLDPAETRAVVGVVPLLLPGAGAVHGRVVADVREEEAIVMMAVPMGGSRGRGECSRAQRSTGGEGENGLAKHGALLS